MRRFLPVLFLLAALVAAGAADGSGNDRGKTDSPETSGRVIKVLPLFLDLQGRDALSPSLFDRDAYQAYLRQHTNEVSAIRFDVLWKASHAQDAKLKLRVELRGIGADGLPSQSALEKEVTPGLFRSWTSLKFDGDEFKQFGSLVAWRTTLWNGDQLLGEQKSFLW